MKSLLSHGSPAVLVAVVLLVESATFASAASYTWAGSGTCGNTATASSDSSTLWGTAGNWSSSIVPGSGDTAWLMLSNAGYVNAQNASINTLYVDGTTAAGALSIGSSVTFTDNNSFYLGYNAIGNAAQGGGTLAVHSLYLGFNPGSSGTYSLSTGSLSAGTEYVGYSGSGAFTQTGGTHSVGSTLYFAYNPGSTGTYVLAGGELIGLSNSPTEYVGWSGTGSFTQTGGINLVNSFLTLGNNTGSSGNYALSNGQLSTTAEEDIGLNGSGTFTQTGGTNSITSSDGIRLGDNAGIAGPTRCQQVSLPLLMSTSVSTVSDPSIKRVEATRLVITCPWEPPERIRSAVERST